MCGGGGGDYTAPKVDPVPTAVESPVQNSDRTANKNQRKKRGSSMNSLSSDRGTILGGLASDGTRTTLG